MAPDIDEIMKPYRGNPHLQNDPETLQFIEDFTRRFIERWNERFKNKEKPQ